MSQIAMVTIRDVARRAGVSLATVSHVVNNTRPVSVPTRGKVERAIKALGYRPNALARSLSTSSSRTIGLMVGSITLPLTARLYRSLEHALRPRGYTLVLRNIDEDPVREAEYLDEFLGRRLDGVLMFPSGNPLPQHAACVKAGIPLVFLNRRPRGIRAPLLELDSARGSADATRYLAGLGHRRIAFLNRDFPFAPFTIRERGYRQAMLDLGLTPNVVSVPGRIDESAPAAEGIVHGILKDARAPTAIIAASHGVSIGLLAGIRSSGLACPRDISVICFDDSPWSMFVNPSLTVMTHPVEEITASAVDTLFAGIEAQEGAGGRRAGRPSAAGVKRFHANFIKRDSCAPPRGD